MKYFDNNGNFKPEIKKSKDICYITYVDGGERIPYSDLTEDVWNEVYINWELFSANSDIVATYWICRSARETREDYSESELLQRIIFSCKKKF